MAKYCLAFETMKLIILNLNPEFRQFAKGSRASLNCEIQSEESSQDENEADDPDECPTTQNNEINKKNLAELVRTKLNLKK